MVTVDSALLCIGAHALQIWANSFPDAIFPPRELTDFRMIAVEAERVGSELRCIALDNILMLLVYHPLTESIGLLLPYWWLAVGISVVEL